MNLPGEVRRNFPGESGEQSGGSWCWGCTGTTSGRRQGCRLQLWHCEVKPLPVPRCLNSVLKGRDRILSFFRFGYLTYRPVSTSFFLCLALQHPIPSTSSKARKTGADAASYLTHTWSSHSPGNYKSLQNP